MFKNSNFKFQIQTNNSIAIPTDNRLWFGYTVHKTTGMQGMAGELKTGNNLSRLDTHVNVQSHDMRLESQNKSLSRRSNDQSYSI